MWASRESAPFQKGGLGAECLPKRPFGDPKGPFTPGNPFKKKEYEGKVPGSVGIQHADYSNESLLAGMAARNRTS
jgi:hypothetical protein